MTKLRNSASTAAQVCALILLLWGCNQAAAWLHSPIPGSVIGLALVVILLMTKVLPEQRIRAGASWLLAELLLFFVPPVVSVLKYRHELAEAGVALFIALIIGTVVVLLGTSFVVDRVFAYEVRRRNGEAA